MQSMQLHRPLRMHPGNGPWLSIQALVTHRFPKLYYSLLPKRCALAACSSTCNFGAAGTGTNGQPYRNVSLSIHATDLRDKTDKTVHQLWSDVIQGRDRVLWLPARAQLMHVHN